MKLLNARAARGLFYLKPLNLCRMMVVRSGRRRAAFDPDSLVLFLLGEADGLLDPSGFEPNPPLTAPAKPRSIVLSLTQDCNLACDYCFVRHRGVKPDVMTVETARLALDMLDPRRQSISFFGGEPFVAWQRLVEIVEIAEGMFDKPRFNITTNGTLLSRESLRFLDAHNFGMIVSLDGPEDLHDRHRRYPDGCPSYDDVARGLNLLAGFPDLARRTTLRATWLPGESEIEARLKELNAWCDNGAASNVAVETATGCAAKDAGGEYAKGEIVRAILAGAEWCVDQARQGRRARFNWLWKTLRTLMTRSPQVSECGAAKGYFGIDPDGRIQACHKAGFPVGTVWRGVRQANAAPWADNRYFAREKCRSCWARNLCGGGCRADSWSMLGNLRVPTSTSCAVGKGRSLAAIRTAIEIADEPAALELIYPTGEAKSCA